MTERSTLSLQIDSDDDGDYDAGQSGWNATETGWNGMVGYSAIHHSPGMAAVEMSGGNERKGKEKE